jgi:hypothetical protein
MANTSAPQLFSGARGRIVFDGKTLALVTNISVSENVALRPTYVVGEMNPVAIDPTAIDVSCSIGRIIPMNSSKSADKLGKTTAIDLGIEHKINDILSKDTVDIQILDLNPLDTASTEKIIAVVKYSRYSGRSFSTNAGDIASENYNFVGILDGGYGGDANPTTDENGKAPINYNF